MASPTSALPTTAIRERPETRPRTRYVEACPHGILMTADDFDPEFLFVE